MERGIAVLIEPIKITEQISYVKASDNPLSADVILVDGQEYLYVFDVGNNEQVAEYLNAIPKKKRVILSHFHTDHMGNIGRVDWESVYFGANTEKYFQHYIPDYAAQRFAELPGALAGALGENEMADKRSFPRYVTVFDTVKIQDGVAIEIHHVPNSHAKGSLLLQVNEEYIFIGDSLYSKVEDDYYVYNAQLLKEEIELLKNLPGTKIFSSHEERPVKAKAGVIRFLEQIYAKREKNDAYIRVSRKE
ncbi:MAG: MBL fold metallo-hydrolase [Lachnospiraceae bacterium]|nr:MBL fold metallo-hydrolase [Lachnospiraceae bacterium]